VYLDEVSLYSLVASQVGLIVTELTETQASSFQSELNASLGASGPIAKAELGTRMQSAHSQSSQVLRKSVVQSTFKQLYGLVHETLAIRQPDQKQKTPICTSYEELAILASTNAAGSLIVDPKALIRGQLFEAEVRLEAEPIFQAGTVISAFLEILEEDPALFGMSDTDQLRQMSTIERVLGKLLAGLVPVRGVVVDFEVVDVNGTELLIHRSLLSQLSPTPATRPLQIVGVAESALFWRDLRRVLFDGSTFRLLARLNRDGLQASWTPVKLVDVLRGVVPEFATVMDDANRNFQQTLGGSAAKTAPVEAQPRMREAVICYGHLLAEHVDIQIGPHELEDLLSQTPDSAEPVLTQDRRKMFEPVTQFIEAKLGHGIDRTEASNLRSAALAQSGLAIGTSAQPDNSSNFLADATSGDERIIDAEIVAIYW
jgi:hypothetical protein